MTVIVYGKPVEITEESIQKTRQWFADNAQACIDQAREGVFKVNDLPRYVEWHAERMRDSLAGKGDHTLTFIQRALYIQTGESVPMLS